MIMVCCGPLLAGARFSCVSPGKPIYRAEKKRHHNDEPWITRRDSHEPENGNVARRHEEHWDENNKESAVHPSPDF
jgi:SRSO17 transposase